jgi:Sporulation related domain.
MKSIITLKLLICFMGLFCILQTYGQSEKESIISELQQDKPNEGKVRIKSDPKITALIGKKNQRTGETTDKSEFEKTSGYRINVFSGNTKESKNNALAIEKNIKESFPDLSTYVTYSSPIWRLRVGDFPIREEAVLLMQELKKAFPSYGKEMKVVTDEIRVFN